MAETQSRLAEIYKAEKSKGGGIASTLGKRTLEKLDPRQFFNQKGFMAAALPSLFKSYSATPAKSGGKVSSLGSGSFSSGALENKLDVLVGETRDVKINSKISAKNSMSLPNMARDMNVMRQNIQKLVKLQGGTATKGADMYFKKSSENEAAYENRFIKERGVKTTPTQVGAKSEEKKGIFATIMEGLSSIFSMKGALIAGILAVLTLGIKEYFSNDEFKGKVDALVSDMFSTIKGFLIEYWKEVAIGLALLFPSATMTLISSGISILSNGITLLSTAITKLAPLFAETLTFAVRSLITLLSGPAGLIILLGGALFAARKLFDQNQEEYLKLAKEKKEKGSLSEKDEARLKELNSPTNEAAAEKQLGYNPITGKAVTQQEANRSMDQRQKDNAVPDKQLKDTAALQLRDEYEAGGKKDSNLDPNNNKNIERRFQELKKAQSAPNESGAEAARLAGSGTKPTPAPFSSAADSQAANTPVPTPTPAPQPPTTSPTKSSTTPITTGPGGAAFGMYPKPGGKNPLLDVIAQGESAGAGGYNAMNQGTPGGGPVIGSGDSQKIIQKKLTDMTVGEIMDKGAKPNDDAAKRKQNGLIFAAGRYQIVPDTLKGLVKQGVVSKEDKFNEETQDKLGTALIKGTGALKLAESGDYEGAQNALAKTWAAIPLATDVGDKKAGQSYYQKAGQNKSMQNLDVKGALMASAGTSSPNQSAALAPNAPSSATTLAAATTAVSKEKMTLASAAPVVNNVTNNNVNNTTTAAKSSQGNIPSAFDEAFITLFDRSVQMS